MRIKTMITVLLLLGVFSSAYSQTEILPKEFIRQQQMYQDNSIQIIAEKQYLNIPIKNKSTTRKVTFVIDGIAEPQNDIEIANGAPDWWAFRNISQYKGKKITIIVDVMPSNSAFLKSVFQSDTIVGTSKLYAEKYRPQFHFTPRRGMKGDVNGLVYYEGEYHLFYQHNPYSVVWGNMHWGHAVSEDLVHWQELSIALYPDKLGTIFSGTGAVDWNNTGGFQTGKDKPLILAYSSAGLPINTGIAYSNDKGRTWTKYENNPALPYFRSGNRDPKLFWYWKGEKWVMIVCTGHRDTTHYYMFSSKNLKIWRYMSEIETNKSQTDCPEFFELPVQGKPDETKWVFYGGMGEYYVGQFDGSSFKAENGPVKLNYGNSFYASLVFSDIPKSDGRTILMPASGLPAPDMPFSGSVGLPVSLTLHQTKDGLRLFAWPVKELEQLRSSSVNFKNKTVTNKLEELAKVNGELFDIMAEIELKGAKNITFAIKGIPLTYDTESNELSCNRTKAKLIPVKGRIQLRALVDRTSLDIFGNEGELYMPMGLVFKENDNSMSLTISGGSVKINSLEVFNLNSAWKH